MAKYMTWGKKYRIKKLISLVGINERTLYKGSNVLRDRERQHRGDSETTQIASHRTDGGLSN